ncbi:MAG: IS110 family transposase [Bacteroidetes bacterium]|nr:IS110 family transposase [Bacteroidota bacterium]
MNIHRQCVGIDISKDTFTASICSRNELDSFTFTEITTFNNDKKGFNQCVRWVRKKSDTSVPVLFLMEATGVYYERLAHHLHKIKLSVCVVLPNTSKHYFKSLNIKTKTDAVDAKALSQMGVERNLKLWSPPSPTLLQLRNLTRYHVQLMEQRTSLQNIKHSKEASHDVQQFILSSNKRLIAQINKQIEQCKAQIEQVIEGDEYLQSKVDKLLTIKGVGLMTVATIIAETLGFEHVKNVKQLVSYAGYDVVERESGTSIKGKTRISKKGNRYIRNALYFPAMVACRFNPELKEQYLRIIQKKPSKMIGQVAIQRKLLVLIYTLWKKDECYIPQCGKEVAQIDNNLSYAR